MDEENIYIVTQYRIKYTKESMEARQNAINAAFYGAANVSGISLITGQYTVNRCSTFWDPAYVPNTQPA